MSEAEPQMAAMPAMREAPARMSGARLRELAVSGGFSIDDSTGNRMIEALESAIEALESRWSELEKLREDPLMSDTPAARWVARNMVDTAADADGLLTQLQAARAEFPTYVEAIELAKRAYRDKEAEVGQEFTGIGDRLGTTEG